MGTDYLSETKTAVGLSMIDDDYGVKHNDVNYLEVTFEIFDKESSDCIGSVPKYRIEINDID